MDKKITASTFKRAPKPIYRPPTFADALLTFGQRLRANEAMTSTTISMDYAAKWQQGQRSAR